VPAVLIDAPKRDDLGNPQIIGKHSVDAIGVTQITWDENFGWEAFCKNSTFVQQGQVGAIARRETQVVKDHNRGHAPNTKVADHIKDKQLMIEI
jgi:hypothetical protein